MNFLNFSSDMMFCCEFTKFILCRELLKILIFLIFWIFQGKKITLPIKLLQNLAKKNVKCTKFIRQTTTSIQKFPTYILLSIYMKRTERRRSVGCFHQIIISQVSSTRITYNAVHASVKFFHSYPTPSKVEY